MKDRNYNSPLEPPKSLGQKFIFVLLLLYTIGGAVCFTIAMLSAASGSTSCMTQAQARRAHPGRHLWWHGSGHCWDANAGGASRLRRTRSLESKFSISKAVPAARIDEPIVAASDPPETAPPAPDFIDRWPETMAAISPQRWWREFVEFGAQR